jgi:hypothetical protein
VRGRRGELREQRVLEWTPVGKVSTQQSVTIFWESDRILKGNGNLVIFRRESDCILEGNESDHILEGTGNLIT